MAGSFQKLFTCILCYTYHYESYITIKFKQTDLSIIQANWSAIQAIQSAF